MIDPYKILNIHKNFTLEELKEAYKIAAIKVHPDKGGNDYLFKLVTQCYKTLKENYRNNDKSHIELKNNFKAQRENFSNKNNDNIDRGNFNSTNSIKNYNFNIAKFNELFTENHTKNKIEELGYSEFLKEDIPKQKQYTKKYNSKNFNAFFDEQVEINKKNKYLKKYKEPEPIPTTSCSYLVLGEDNVDDFSSDPLNGNLNYTDLKIAHTTSRIVDPNIIKSRKQYDSVEQLMIDREKINYNMSDKYKKYYDKKEKIEKMKEIERLKKIKKDDDEIEENYNRVMKIFNQLK